MIKSNYIILILFLFSANIVCSNTSYIDSLLSKYSHETNINEKITQLNKITVYYYQQERFEESLNFANKMIEFALKNNMYIKQADALNIIGNIYKKKGDYEIAFESFEKARNIFLQYNDKNGLSLVYNNISLIYKEKGDLNNALEIQLKSLKIKESILNSSKSNTERNEVKKSITYSLNNIGNLYQDMNNYKKAYQYYLQSLNLMEEIGDKHSISNSYNNIGINYARQNNYPMAIEYYNKSLYILKDIGDTLKIATAYNNLGIIYGYMNEFEKSGEAYKQSLSIAEKSGNESYIAEALNNIAVNYSYLNDNKNSLLYFIKALDIFKKSDDKPSMAILLGSIGLIYFNMGNHAKAIQIFEESNKIAKEIQNKPLIKNNYKDMAEIYLKQNNFRKAYDCILNYSIIKDTIYNEESQKLITEMQTKYDTEKKEKQIMFLNKDKLLKNLELGKKHAEIKKQRIIIIFFITGLSLVIVFSFFLFKLYTGKKKANRILNIQNAEITQQKEEIETQRDEIETQRNLLLVQKDQIEIIHGELKDSIYYAKRIQNATLSSEKIFEEYFDGYFIMFNPRDIVSGDFYWATRINDWLLIAVADCTGHGVPGAFMSMLGMTLLNEITRNAKITQANKVLNELRKRIIEALNQKGTSGEQKDGMDIAFCAINLIPIVTEEKTEFFEMQFAGANNPCWIVTQFDNLKMNQFENESPDKLASGLPFPNFQISKFPNLFELKGDKMPIGIHLKMNPFTNNIFRLQKGDSIYLMSDGFEDQFGEQNHKKFMSKNLKNLLTANSQQPMSEQKESLYTIFENWKGKNDQIDDVTVLGIKI